MQNNTDRQRNKSPRRIKKSIGNYTYDQIDKIGFGFSSTVFKGFNNMTGSVVAIKVIDLNQINTPISKTLLKNEINVLRQLNHPNLLKVHDIYLTQNNTYIISEYCDEGDIADLIFKNKVLDEKIAFNLMKQILQGMKELQKQQILHRDIKPANILMTNGVPKLADFGFAVNLDQQLDESILQNFNVGTPLYMAPETILNNQYSQKSDIWALGVVLFEMLHGYPPFKAPSNSQLVNQYLSTPVYFLISVGLSKQAKELIINMLMLDQQTRFGLDQVIDQINSIMQPATKLVTFKDTNSSLNFRDAFQCMSTPQSSEPKINFRSLSVKNRDLQRVPEVSHKTPVIQSKRQTSLEKPKKNQDQINQHENQDPQRIHRTNTFDSLKKLDIVTPKTSLTSSPKRQPRTQKVQTSHLNKKFPNTQDSELFVNISPIENFSPSFDAQSVNKVIKSIGDQFFQLAPALLENDKITTVDSPKPQIKQYEGVEKLSQNDRALFLFCKFLNEQADQLENYLNQQFSNSPPSLFHQRSILSMKCSFLFWKCMAIKAYKLTTNLYFSYIQDQFMLRYQQLQASIYLPNLIESDRRFQILFDSQVEDDCSGFYAILTHYVSELIKCLMKFITRLPQSQDKRVDNDTLQMTKQMHKLTILHTLLWNHLKCFNSLNQFVYQCLSTIEEGLLDEQKIYDVDGVNEILNRAKNLLRIN